MAVIYTNSHPVLGNIKVVATPTLASRAAPSIATLNGGTAVDLSGALTADGWRPATTQGKTTRIRRLASTADTERLTPASFTIPTLMWSVGDPQAPDTTINTLMVEGALLYITERLGKDADLAFAISDKVISRYVRLGVPYAIYDPTADNAEFLRGVEIEFVDAGPVDGVCAA